MVALAGLLGVLLVGNTARFGNRESIVVSLQGLDTATVVSLADSPARKNAGSVRHEADANPVAAVGMVDAVAADNNMVSPITDVLPRANPLRSATGVDIRDIKTAAFAPASEASATLVGIASTYNPNRYDDGVDVAVTASGEPYDPDAWTAAIQIDLRAQFGGVRYGRLYRPVYALVESGGESGVKRVIVKINDVGPLRPGRVIDLNERAMRYFDPSLERGLLPDMKVSLLPGNDWTPGPVGDAPVGKSLVSKTSIDMASAL